MESHPAVEDLTWLFEVEPRIEFEDLGYPVSATTFVTTRGETRVECTIEPYMNSVTVVLDERGDERVRLHLWGIVNEGHVDRHDGHEALVLSFVADVPFDRLRLELKPIVRLVWESVKPWAPGVSTT
jgi:hypothetical protein